MGFVPIGELNIVTFVDVTNRKTAEDEIRKKEAFAIALMDNFPIDLSINSDFPSVDISYMNDQFPLFYRTSRDALKNPGRPKSSPEFII